jgi:hypothetical protein
MTRALSIAAAIAAAAAISAATTVSLPQSPAAPFPSCYTNADGACVLPTSAPSAPQYATAHCNDGTWSYIKNNITGTCPHGGVDYWLTRPPS